MYVSILGKLSEIHLHAWLFSNPCGKVLLIVEISWSPDLRVQLTQAQLSAAVKVQLGFESQPQPKQPFLTSLSKINGQTKIERAGT